MIDYADEIAEVGAPWSTWAATQFQQPIWLARIDASDEAERIVGCFVIDARTALGLRPWDDADEGIEPAPWALFDIEKLVRMALHQSGLAFEALTAPQTWGEFPARRVADAAVTQGVLRYYYDVTASLLDGNTQRWRWRTLLTGALLAREGVMSQSLTTLCDRLAVPAQPDASLATELRAELEHGALLPSRPSDYHFLNELVVSARLSAS